MSVDKYRIGNLVNYKNPKRISANDFLKIKLLGYRPRPIKLTPYWLTFFGFKTNMPMQNIPLWQKDRVLVVDRERPKEKYESERKISIKHVHELQNLYFEQTGKTLELIKY